MNRTTNELECDRVAPCLELALGEISRDALGQVLRARNNPVTVHISGVPYDCIMGSDGIEVYRTLFEAEGTTDQRGDSSYSYVSGYEYDEYDEYVPVADPIMTIPVAETGVAEFQARLTKLYELAQIMADDHGLTLEDCPIRLGRIHLCYDDGAGVEYLRGRPTPNCGLVVSTDKVELIDIEFTVTIGKTYVYIGNVVRAGAPTDTRVLDNPVHA